jgi:hypothetical protein
VGPEQRGNGGAARTHDKRMGWSEGGWGRGPGPRTLMASLALMAAGEAHTNMRHLESPPRESASRYLRGRRDGTHIDEIMIPAG